MSVQERIEKKLRDFFRPTHLFVQNESRNHRLGEDTHFHLILVSEKFEQVSRIDRQRQVNQLLQEELDGGVHALSMRALTPEEWKTQGEGKGPPPCRGGDQPF